MDQKKRQHLPELATTLVPPTRLATPPVLELDELWSFVLRKIDKAWVWIALCRQTRQIVAYVVGDRSERTGRRLWRAIPRCYRHSRCYSDFWAAYAAIVPQRQHRAVGKETGQTAHVERWNNTLRQRLARFVRKTLSFSKSPVMHEACLALFIHRYNQERALLWM